MNGALAGRLSGEDETINRPAGEALSARLALGGALRSLHGVEEADPTVVLVPITCAAEADRICAEYRNLYEDAVLIGIDATASAAARVAALKAGAADCLSVPVDPDELALRVANVAASAIAGRLLQVGCLCLDRYRRSARCNDHELVLTHTEFGLLEAFMECPGLVLRRRDLYRRVWGYDFEDRPNPLGTYVGYLRRKLSAVAEETPTILTVRGRGYMLAL